MEDRLEMISAAATGSENEPTAANSPTGKKLSRPRRKTKRPTRRTGRSKNRKKQPSRKGKKPSDGTRGPKPKKSKGRPTAGKK